MREKTLACAKVMAAYVRAPARVFSRKLVSTSPNMSNKVFFIHPAEII
jgi:hypothetical protein